MKVLQINKHHFIKGGADRVYFNTGNLLTDNQHEVIYFSTNHPNNFNSQFSDFFVPFSTTVRQALPERLSTQVTISITKQLIKILIS